MSRRMNQLRAVVVRELWREQTDRRQMQLPAADGSQELRMPPHRAHRLDPLICNALREVQHPLTPDEHRRATLIEIKTASIHLSEVCEQLGLHGIPALDQLAHSHEQLGIRQPSEHF
jgi:hypothetical protein